MVHSLDWFILWRSYIFSILMYSHILVQNTFTIGFEGRFDIYTLFMIPGCVSVLCSCLFLPFKKEPQLFTQYFPGFVSSDLNHYRIRNFVELPGVYCKSNPDRKLFRALCIPASSLLPRDYLRWARSLVIGYNARLGLMWKPE